MERYEVRPYTRGGYVIVETNSGKEVFIFSSKEAAEAACRVLNAD